MDFQKHSLIFVTNSHTPSMTLLLIPTVVLLYNQILLSSGYIQQTIAFNSSQVMDNIKEWTYTFSFLTTTLTLLPLALYLIYYLTKCGVPTIVAHPKSSLLKIVKAKCPVLSRTFYPSLLFPSPDLQSLSVELTDLFNLDKSVLKLDTKPLLMPDGEQVFLSEPDEPLLVSHDIVTLIVPGYMGDHTCSYVLKIVEGCLKAATWPIVFTDRGKGGQPLKVPKFFHAGVNEGLTVALDHLIQLHPNKQVVVVGISFGGMVACNTVHAYHRKDKIRGLLMLSSPLNAPKTSQHLNTFRNKTLYSRPFGNRVKQLLKASKPVFLQTSHSTQLYSNLTKCQTITDIDKMFIAPMYGYRNSEHYYSDICLSKVLPHLTVPTVILNADDDPNFPSESFPLHTIQTNSNLCMVTTKAGGHFGYAGLLWPLITYNFSYQFLTESLYVFKELE